MSADKDSHQQSEPEAIDKIIDFEVCPQHGKKFPKGERCPACSP